MLVRPVQSKNANDSIEVTLSGIVMLVRPVQRSNAYDPIEVTGNPPYVLGISKDPLAVTSQSDTAYSVPALLSVKTSPACTLWTKKSTKATTKPALNTFIDRN
jgi:hypothetical protein